MTSSAPRLPALHRARLARTQRAAGRDAIRAPRTPRMARHAWHGIGLIMRSKFQASASSNNQQHIVAVNGGATVRVRSAVMEFVSMGGLLAVGLLVVANGFFVAAEVALIAERRSRIEQLVAEGNVS